MSKNCFPFFIFLYAPVFFVVHAFIPPPLAKAATINVASSTQLSAALATAQANGEDDTIRIAQGNYPGNFIYSSHEAKSLVIQGGWTTDFSSRTVQPANTVLDGQSQGTVLVISCDREINLTVEGLTIQNGLVRDQHGGGLFISNYRNELIEPNTTTVRNCIVRNNRSENVNAGHDGGGIYLWTSTHVVVAQNTVYGNSTVCENENWYARGGGIFIDTTKFLYVYNNLIYGNQAANGGGLWTYQNCWNCLEAEQASIRANTIRDNVATLNGGGLFAMQYGPTTFAGNILEGNSAGSQGGGIYLWGYDDRFTLVNNLLVNNSAAKSGGGMSVVAPWDTVLTLTNNTIAENQAGSHGGGLELILEQDTTTAYLSNNIIWRNDSFNPGRDLYIENDQDENYLAAVCSLHNNDFNQGGWGTWMHIPFPIPAGNLNNLDPLFAQPSAGDYRLGQGSPCLDTGSNSAPSLPATDLAGTARMQGQVVDIGAYEGVFARKSTPVLPLIIMQLLK